jgi:hypothetical protein
MKYTDRCKGCLANVNIPSEDIRKMVEEIANNEEFSIVSEKVYGERLDKCMNCEYLQYGTTCMQCGCIVQVRALLYDKNCPHPKGSIWDI